MRPQHIESNSTLATESTWFRIKYISYVNPKKRVQTSNNAEISLPAIRLKPPTGIPKLEALLPLLKRSTLLLSLALVLVLSRLWVMAVLQLLVPLRILMISFVIKLLLLLPLPFSVITVLVSNVSWLSLPFVAFDEAVFVVVVVELLLLLLLVILMRCVCSIVVVVVVLLLRLLALLLLLLMLLLFVLVMCEVDEDLDIADAPVSRVLGNTCGFIGSSKLFRFACQTNKKSKRIRKINLNT